MVVRSAVLIELRRRAFSTAPTSALAAMYLGGCAAYILSSLFPLSPLAPVRFYEIGAVICAFASPLIFLLGERWSTAVLPVGIAGAITLLSLTVSTARTGDGTAVTAFAFQWLCVYLAYFLPWRIAIAYMAAAMVALNIALIHNQIHWERHTRVAITVSFIAIFALLARLVDQLRTQASTDQLTGLLNRKGLADAARAAVPKALRRGQAVTLCAIDLDDFKAVNDEVGHIGADHLLVDLAHHWKTVLGSRSIVARYGGDEFVIISCGIGIDAFEPVLDAMRANSPLAWSAGCAPLTDIETIDSAINEADTMLYKVKSEKRSAK